MSSTKSVDPGQVWASNVYNHLWRVEAVNGTSATMLCLPTPGAKRQGSQVGEIATFPIAAIVDNCRLVEG